MKNFDSQPKSAFGEDLAKLRRVKNLTLEKVAALTKIQSRYLERLEKGEFAKLPADVYVRGIIAKYAKIVDADSEELWKRFEGERGLPEELARAGKSEKIARRSGYFDRLPQNRFLNVSSLAMTPRLMTIFSLTLVLFLVLGYFFYQFKYLVGAPNLSVFEPSADILTAEKKIKLVGMVEAGAILTINGRPAGLSSDGRFEEELALQPGVNMIEFLAKNHLGKISTVKRTVVLSAPTSAIGDINISESGESETPATSTYQ